MESRFVGHREAKACRYISPYLTPPEDKLTPPTARAKELGCQEPPEFPNQGFLGLKHIGQMQEADKQQKFPDLMLSRQEQMNQITGRVCSTFKFHLLGQELYFTSDPKNIQALLATKFDDFYLGSARRSNMIATLGDGIVSFL